ncbi:MAG TPA: hypothetical protein DIS76_02760 [Rhodospirillaceae bacterium]|nr:hypothetical protein [Rhodospirillaceae bacterium]
MAELRAAAVGWPSPLFEEMAEFYALSPTSLFIDGKLGDQRIGQTAENKSAKAFEDFLTKRLRDDLRRIEQISGIPAGSLDFHFTQDIRMRTVMFTAATEAVSHSVQTTYGEVEIPQSCNLFIARLNGLPKDSQDIMAENLGYFGVRTRPFAFRSTLTLAEETSFEFFHEATHFCQIAMMQEPGQSDARAKFIYNHQLREVMADTGSILFILREGLLHSPEKSWDEIVHKAVRIVQAHMDYREISNTNQLRFNHAETTPYAPSSPILASLLDRLQDHDSALELLEQLKDASVMDVAKLACAITDTFFDQPGWLNEYNTGIRRRAKLLNASSTPDNAAELAEFNQMLDRHVIRDAAEARRAFAESIQAAWQTHTAPQDRNYYFFQKCFTLAQTLSLTGLYDYSRRDDVNRFIKFIRSDSNRQDWPEFARFQADGILSIASDRFKPTQRRDIGLRI